MKGLIKLQNYQTEYKQCKLKKNQKKETRNAQGKCLICLYSSGISQVNKIRDVKNYSKILRIIHSSEIKCLGCPWRVLLVILLCLFYLLRIQSTT